MIILIDILSFLFLITGSSLSIIGGLGLIRLPDFYSRLHAAGITDTLATYLIISGLILQSGLNIVSAKLILILLFIFFTSPVSSHLIAKIAFDNGLDPLNKKNENVEGGQL